MPFNIGPGELIIVLVIALIVVGPGKLPDVGAALGKSIREFRKAAADVKETTTLEAPANGSGQASQAAAATSATAAPATAQPAPNTLAQPAPAPNTLAAPPAPKPEPAVPSPQPEPAAPAADAARAVADEQPTPTQ
jgi:TatA/E family protein of Tat protein translocase